MSEHFIKDIEIKNYKCFKDFKAKGFGRVNLIGGANNVGKTAFMEACYIALSKKIIQIYYSLLSIQTYRNGIEMIKKNTTFDNDIRELIQENKNFEFKTNLGLTFIKELEDKYQFSFLGQEEFKTFQDIFNTLQVQSNQNMKWATSSNFISSYFLDNTMLCTLINQLKLTNKYDEFNLKINSLFGSEKIDVIDNKIYIKYDNEFQEMYKYGQGIKNILSIVLSLLVAEKRGVLFIDEIENGIHYTKLDELWEIILEISKEQNVQVFATTHSKEAIESYARVAKRLEDEDVSFVSLYKDDEEIKSIIFDYDKIQTRLELDLDNR
jgi:AAA15 family ATPase/GTPase